MFNSLLVREQNLSNLFGRQITQPNRVGRGLNHDVVETKPIQDTITNRVGSIKARGRWLVQIAAESCVKILDDPDRPVRVGGRNPKDLGRTLVLLADAEGALLLGRVGIRGGFGFEIGGPFGSGR